MQTILIPSPLNVISYLSKASDFREWIEKPHDFPIKEFVWHDQFGVETVEHRFIGYSTVYCVIRIRRFSDGTRTMEKRKHFRTIRSLLKYLNGENMMDAFLSHYDPDVYISD